MDNDDSNPTKCLKTLISFNNMYKCKRCGSKNLSLNEYSQLFCLDCGYEDEYILNHKEIELLCKNNGKWKNVLFVIPKRLSSLMVSLDVRNAVIFILVKKREFPLEITHYFIKQ